MIVFTVLDTVCTSPIPGALFKHNCGDTAAGNAAPISNRKQVTIDLVSLGD
jgi:hypothetical protein